LALPWKALEHFFGVERPKRSCGIVLALCSGSLECSQMLEDCVVALFAARYCRESQALDLGVEN
jgi:hypothetical protein